MGWASGTDIFDAVCEEVLESDIPKDDKKRILTALINAMEDHDWDCQNDSRYYENSLVQKIFKDIHPEWFEDEDY